MYKLVVSCSNRTKKCILEASSLEDLIDNLKEKFEVNDAVKVHVQYYDKEVEEFIDLDSLEFIEEDVFTKVKLFCESSSALQLSGVTELNDSLINQPLTDSSRTSTPVPLSRPVTPLSCSSDDLELPKLSAPKKSLAFNVQSCNPESKISTCTPNDGDKKRKLKLWPKVYTFPEHTVPVSTMIKLQNGQDIAAKDRRDILTGIYQDVTTYEGGLYPTAERFNAILDCILRTFPNITKQEGLDLDNSRELWKDRLRIKFQNSRKRVDGDLPEIVMKKKKKSKDEQVNSVAGPTTWGMKNYCPPRPDTEDETTADSHIKWLQTAVRRKENVDEVGISRRMQLTLWHRRQIIVEEKKGIEEILLMYPALSSVHELVKEFLRLGPLLAEDNSDISVHFERTLMKYSGAVAALSKGKKSAALGHESLLRKSEFRCDSDREYVEKCCTLLCLPSLFRENIGTVVMTDTQFQTCEEPPKVAICFAKDVLARGEDDFKLVCEGIVIFKTNGLISSILGLMMAIYTFNLAYPKTLEKTLLILQRVFLGVDDEITIDKRLLIVMAQLNKAVSSTN